MLICPVCGKLNGPRSRSCDLCGAPLAGAEQQAGIPASPMPVHTGGPNGSHTSDGLSGPVCPVCRRTNRAISVFCAYCGYRLKPADNPPVYTLPNIAGASGGLPAQPPPGAIALDESGNIPVGTLLKRRYRILRKIAQGGMGAVYESTDIMASQGARWAVKEMSPQSLPSSERTQAIADFRREAQMLAHLSHDNLPRVQETFEEFGKHFLVMEFVPGRTLQNVIDTTPGFIPEERIRVWARQIFDVLTYLHSQNPPIIYRDIKPANVMLLEGIERIKLIDFGIARFHKAGKTRDTEAFGTAGYAPPEQYGKGQTDQRSDVYALAATLHYLCTKHDPGLNPFNWLPVRQYNAAISPEFDAALQRALNLDPQKRFPSITEFASALGFQSAFGSRQHDPIAPGVPDALVAERPLPAQAPATAQPRPRQRSGASRSNSSSGTKSKPQAPPPTPAQLPVYTPPAVAPVASAAPVVTAATPAETAPPTTSVPDVVVDTNSGNLAASPKSKTGVPHPEGTRPPKSIEPAPALVVSDRVLDLGEARWNSSPLRKISLRNAGGGEMKGTVVATQPWVALNMGSFHGNAQTIEVRVKKRMLPLGRVELHVPNLFAIIWARTRWALPFIGCWFWVLLLVASSVGRQLLWVVGGAVALLLLAEGLMWWWALHVRLLVPAARLNSGRLLVKSSGGEQQIEVRVKAQPSWGRKALGWSTAALLMAVELGAVVWIVLALLGYEVALPVGDLSS